MKHAYDFKCHKTGASGRMWLSIPIDMREIEYVCRWFSGLNENHVVTCYHGTTDIFTVGI